MPRRTILAPPAASAVPIIAATDLDSYLRSTPVINCDHADVLTLARRLAGGLSAGHEVARICFEWVRDEIPHTVDCGAKEVTCAASDVLASRTGFCFAKSHLLVALLPANGLPAGLCYQRLALDDSGSAFSLHGLAAVYLPEMGWYRIDPRGNKPGVDAQFTPPQERLAYPVQLPGEHLFPEVLPDPLPLVVEVLQTYQTAAALMEALPDISAGTSLTLR